MKWKRFGLPIIMLLAIGCEAERGLPVSQEQFGEQWPLTLPNGRLSCIYFRGRRQIVTFISPDGKEYALNGQASNSGYFNSINSIQKPDPANPPAKKSIGVLIDKGLKLCPNE